MRPDIDEPEALAASQPRARKRGPARLAVDPDNAQLGIDNLDHLDPDLLRRRWRAVMGRPAPPRLSRQLLIRILAWREQIARVGDLDAATLATLKVVLNGGDNSTLARPNASALRQPRPGSVLVREHGGVIHRIMVLGRGYAWNGQTFGSLSSVARAITGTVWNGRRFFGLDKVATDEKLPPRSGRKASGGAQ